MKRFGLLFAAVFVFAMLAAGACTKKAQEEETEGTTEVKKITIKEGGEGMEVETEEGTMVIESDDESGDINIKTKEGKKFKISY